MAEATTCPHRSDNQHTEELIPFNNWWFILNDLNGKWASSGWLLPSLSCRAVSPGEDVSNCSKLKQVTLQWLTIIPAPLHRMWLSHYGQKHNQNHSLLSLCILQNGSKALWSQWKERTDNTISLDQTHHFFVSNHSDATDLPWPNFLLQVLPPPGPASLPLDTAEEQTDWQIHSCWMLEMAPTTTLSGLRVGLVVVMQEEVEPSAEPWWLGLGGSSHLRSQSAVTPWKLPRLQFGAVGLFPDSGNTWFACTIPFPISLQDVFNLYYSVFQRIQVLNIYQTKRVHNP